MTDSIGGNGASKALYDRFQAAIRRALRILMECPCRVAALDVHTLIDVETIMNIYIRMRL